MTRECTKCGEIKDLSLFYKEYSKRKGYAAQCKTCVLKEQKKRYYKKHDEIREKQNQYYNKIKQSEEKYSHLKEVQSKYQREHKEQHNIANKKYREKYPERQREYKKNYIMPIESRIRQREYDRKKTREDINFKISKNLRARIWQAIFRPDKNYKKWFPFKDVLGCSKEFFKLYLESKFTKGMSWDNYGYYGWHIDHIKPVSSFNLTDSEQQKLCFHYTNLQPLWQHDNQTKSKKLVA